MNAPRLCKLRKNCPTSTGHGAMVLTKPLHFCIFQLPKTDKDHCALANCGGVEFPKPSIYSCKLQNENIFYPTVQ
jgi:hypothetical protein